MDIKFEKTKYECLENLNSLGAAAEVCEFIADVLDCEHQINQTSSKFVLDLSNLLTNEIDLEKVIKLIQKMVKSYRGWGEKVVELQERVVNLPDSPSIDPHKMNTVHSFKASSTIHSHGLSLKEGELVTVTDTTVPNQLKVRDRRGNEGYLPLLTCLIPSPHPGLRNSVYKLRVQLIASWREMLTKLRSTIPPILPPFLHPILKSLEEINNILMNGGDGGSENASNGFNNNSVGDGVYLERDCNNNVMAMWCEESKVCEDLNGDGGVDMNNNANETSNRNYGGNKRNNNNNNNNNNKNKNPNAFSNCLLSFKKCLELLTEALGEGEGVGHLGRLRRVLRKVENSLVNADCVSGGLMEGIADIDKLLLMYMAFRDSLKRLNDKPRTGSNSLSTRHIRIQNLDYNALYHCQSRSIRYFEVKLTATESTTIEEKTYNKPPPKLIQQPHLPLPHQPQPHMSKPHPPHRPHKTTSRTTQIDSITDPRSGAVLTLQEAIKVGVLNHKSGHLVNQESGERMPIAEAIKKGLIRVSRRNVGCGGEESNGVEKNGGVGSLDRGLEEKENELKKQTIHQLINPQHQQNICHQRNPLLVTPKKALSGLITLKRSILRHEYVVESAFDALKDEHLSLVEARRRGVVVGGLYRNNESGEVVSLDEAVKVGWVVVRGNDTAVGCGRDSGLDNGGSGNVTGAGDIVINGMSVKDEEVSLFRSRKDNKKVDCVGDDESRDTAVADTTNGRDEMMEHVTYSVQQVYDTKKEQYVTFLEAVKRKLVDAESGCFVNNVTTDLKYPAEAIVAGEFIVEVVKREESVVVAKPIVKKISQFNLFNKSAHPYFGKQLFLDFQGDDDNNFHDNQNMKEKCISIYNVDV